MDFVQAWTKKDPEIPSVLRGSCSMELEAQLYFVVGLSRLYGMPPVILHSGERVWNEERWGPSLVMNGEACKYHASHAKALCS